VGAADQPAVDTLLVAHRAQATERRTRRGAHVYAAAAPDPQTRRAVLSRALAATGVATLAVAGVATLRRGAAAAGQSAATLHTSPKHHASTTPGTTTTTTRTSAQTGPRLPDGAVKLGSSSQLPADAAAIYKDPATGSPDIIIRHADRSLTAFSAVCTHAGCTVDFQSGVIACPCHGSEFDANTGAVLRGPAATPLGAKRVIERRGSIYAV